jgi:hypothetical protein
LVSLITLSALLTCDNMPSDREGLRIQIHKARRESNVASLEGAPRMPDWAWMIVLVVGYVALTQWLLPKLGVPT